LEGLENGFGEGHGGETNGKRPVMRPGKGPDTTLPRPLPGPFTGYSYLSASIGSSRAARLAGYSPNPTPVRADAPSAATTDHSGTWAGMGVRLATANASTPPTSIPTAPPPTQPGQFNQPPPGYPPNPCLKM